MLSSRLGKAIATLVVASGLLLVAYSQTRYGLRAQSSLQISYIIPVLFAGLLLGRKSMWITAVAMQVCLGLGLNADLSRGTGWEDGITILLQPALGCLLVALILDRMIARSDDATRRSEELDLLCDQLEIEIRERKAKQAELVHSKKMEVLGQFSSGVAHDFNNLLNVILGHVRDPLAVVSLDSAQSSLDGVEKAATRGVNVVKRLLTLTRNQGPMGVFDASEALRDLLPLLESLFGRHVSISCSLPDCPTPILMDKDEFDLALLNIAKNSRDAMPSGGSFGISILPVGRKVQIMLSDSGSGIPEDLLERVFEPFFTTKGASDAPASGTGIGLSTVYQSVILAGGSITADSRDRQGTSVRILLPLATQSTDVQT